MATSGQRSRPGPGQRPAQATRRPAAQRPQTGKRPPSKGQEPAPAPKQAPRKGFWAGKAEPHHDERASTVIARNAYSRERYEFLLRTLFVLLALLGFSLTGNVYLGIRQPEQVYFALASDGRITPITPLDSPVQSIEQVTTWTTEAVVRAFTLSFANYQQQLEDSRNLFTDSGWAGFQDALSRNGVLDTIIAQKLVSSAVPAGAPVVAQSGIGSSGRYSWRVELPLLVTYDSASGRNSQTLNVEAVVQRVPETENPRGLSIGQIIAR